MFYNVIIVKLVKYPNPKIRTISKNVKLPLNQRDLLIVKKMITYIDESQKPNSLLREGIGIAAIQLGYAKRMFYVNVLVKDENVKEVKAFKEFLINPVVLEISKEKAALKNGEGCLSVNPKDDVFGLVHRQRKIKVEGFSYFQNKKVVYELEDLLAIVFQHELAHLDGKLYFDFINKTKPWIKLKNEKLI
ncbi:MAG: peptide deformylase [Mycoplasma sp.]|nr:peptide deformylase [Mycoplasma sp.]